MYSTATHVHQTGKLQRVAPKALQNWIISTQSGYVKFRDSLLLFATNAKNGTERARISRVRQELQKVLNIHHLRHMNFFRSLSILLIAPGTWPSILMLSLLQERNIKCKQPLAMPPLNYRRIHMPSDYLRIKLQKLTPHRCRHFHFHQPRVSSFLSYDQPVLCLLQPIS